MFRRRSGAQGSADAPECRCVLSPERGPPGAAGRLSSRLVKMNDISRRRTLQPATTALPDDPDLALVAEKLRLMRLLSQQRRYAGLPTPRLPAELRGGSVVTQAGTDFTAQYARGAREALHLARLCGCTLAILKERSPSCGHGSIHDGSFTGALTPGDGVTAALLRENGIEVIGESEIEAFFAPGGSGAAF